MKQVKLPRYQQIAVALAEKIVANQLKIGEKIYARSTLANTYGVSPETARKAITVLTDLKIVTPIHGSGVLISSRENAKQFIEQYQDTQSIEELKQEIMTSVERQKKELQSVSEILDKLVAETKRFHASNPLNPFVLELREPSEQLGKTVSEMNLWQHTTATLVAILSGNDFLVSPGPYAKISQGDTIYFVGAEHTLQRVQNYFYPEGPQDGVSSLLKDPI